MKNQRLESETLLIAEKRPPTFPRYRAKRIDPSIRKPGGQSNRHLNPRLLRKLDLFSKLYHTQADLLKRGVYLFRLEGVEREIARNMGGILDDR